MGKQPQNNNSSMQYLSFAWQLIAGLALSVYIGIVLDKWLKFTTPVFVWVLPLLVLAGMMVKVIRDTTKK